MTMTPPETGDSTLVVDPSDFSSASEEHENASYLVIASGTGPLLHEIPEQVLIGRGDGNSTPDFVRLRDKHASREHVRIKFGLTGWQIEDCSKRNRTYLDGCKLQKGSTVDLDDGALIRVGETLVVFRRGNGRPVEPSFDHLPGIARQIQRVRSRLRRAAQSDWPILILGPTGSGKERAARAVHDLGPRASGPYEPINCATLKPGIAYAELFGSTAGAYTGAQPRQGIIASADKGTVFLDEVGDLNLEVQAELLRFLDDGSYRRLGETQEKRADVRIVAATNVALDKAVKEGRFREDLLARLEGANTVDLPPLRQRREDIPMWATTFLAEVATQAGRPDLSISAGAMECMMLYGWSRNLRELRSVVRTAAEAADGPIISASHLSGPVQQARRAARKRDADESPAFIRNSLPNPDKKAIEAALLSTAGNVKAAAEQLGIERTKLYRLLREHGIEPTGMRPRPPTPES